MKKERNTNDRKKFYSLFYIPQYTLEFLSAVGILTIQYSEQPVRQYECEHSFFLQCKE